MQKENHAWLNSLGVVLALLLGITCAYLLDGRRQHITMLEARVAAAEANQNYTERQLKELKAVVEAVASGNASAEAWIMNAEPAINQLAMDLMGRDEQLRQWLLQVRATADQAIASADALQKQVAALETKVAGLQKAKKAHSKYANKQCNKPKVRCVGENPMRCTVQ